MFLVATVDQNWAIGKKGRLLYDIPANRAYFRELVRGHTIVYGHNSLNTYTKPIEESTNLILTHDMNFTHPGATIIHDISELDKYHDVYVVGGEHVYWQLYKRCKYAYITHVETVTLNSDAFFPKLSEMPNWQKIVEAPVVRYQGLPYHAVTYVNNAVEA